MRIAMLEQKLEQRAEEVMERHTRELNQKFGNALEAMHHELVTRMTTGSTQRCQKYRTWKNGSLN